MKDKNQEWECPICNHYEYEQDHDNKLIVLFECLGCSVYFSDPNKFNKVRINSCSICFNPPEFGLHLVNLRVENGKIIKLCGSCFEEYSDSSGVQHEK